MSGLPKEELTEETIVKFLTSQPILDANGQPTADMEYRQIDAAEYNQNEQNKENCILTSELIAFLKDTQAKEYQKMLDVLGGEEQVASNILSRIGTEMRTKLRAATAANVHNKNSLLPAGTLSLLRGGQLDAGYGAKFTLLYARPASNKNPDHDALYRKNRLAIVRQLQYSKDQTKEIDLAIFVLFSYFAPPKTDFMVS
jgi:type I restriction enzyme R subunit